jgi:hypothetical protein
MLRFPMISQFADALLRDATSCRAHVFRSGGLPFDWFGRINLFRILSIVDLLALRRVFEIRPDNPTATLSMSSCLYANS